MCKPRAILPEPEPVVQWLEPLKNGTGLVHVVVETTKGPVETMYRVVVVGISYQMQKQGDTKTYNVRPSDWHCTCPDQTYRPERRGCCKHVKALQEALKQIKE